MEPELPKRVIDVLPPLGHEYVCLIEARGSHDHYAALSHCWGPQNLRPLTITISTLQDRLRGIEIRNRPKSFQDAVSVARASGIRYLWIDSLCIVQDDHDDWLEQSQQMGTFYERSRFTIAAADAVNSHQGFFRTLPRKAIPITYHDKSGKERGSIFVMEPEEPSRLEGSPLATRAWVTQEIILSRRIISYTEYGLLWSCMRRNETEVGEKSVIGSIFERSTDWSEIVSLYSAKQLTYPKDKLIALQGIANSLQKKSQDSYLSVLWASGLPSNLLWSVKTQDFRDAKRLPETLNLPSWSWVSVQAPISPSIPGMWAIRAKLACGEVIVKEEGGRIRLQVDGLLARAPELAIEVTEAVATHAHISWNSLVSGLEGEKMLRIDKTRRLVPLNQVEMPDDLRYAFQQGPNTLPAAIKVCKCEKNTDYVIGWCLMDDGRDIASEAFVLRLMCQESLLGTISNFVLFLQRCEGGSEMYRRIGMGMINDQQHSKWFKGTNQRKICII